MIMVKLFISLLALFILNSCVDEGIIESDEPIPLKGKVVLSATNVEIGQKLFAHFKNMDSVKVYSVTLNEKKVTFKQIDDSTVTLIAPYTNVGTDAGNFVFYCYLPKSGVSDTVLVSNRIRYRYEDWMPGPYMKWNVYEKVTEYESWKYDGFGQKAWKMEAVKDTIRLIRQYTCHDECGIKETIVFLDKGINNVPKFLYAQYNRNEWMKAPVAIKFDRFSKIMLDSWDGSIFSGTFSAQDNSWIFWFKK